MVYTLSLLTLLVFRRLINVLISAAQMASYDILVFFWHHPWLTLIQSSYNRGSSERKLSFHSVSPPNLIPRSRGSYLTASYWNDEQHTIPQGSVTADSQMVAAVVIERLCRVRHFHRQVGQVSNGVCEKCQVPMVWALHLIRDNQTIWMAFKVLLSKIHVMLQIGFTRDSTYDIASTCHRPILWTF